MSDYLIVDGHVHTFATADLGRRVAEAIDRVESSGGQTGTIEETLRLMERDGVSKVVMANWLPVANMRDAALRKLPMGLPDYGAAEREVNDTLVGRLVRRNQWTCEVGREHPNLIPFITMDPVLDAGRMRSEIRDRVQHHGARGLKIQFAGQRLFPHDRRLWPAYEVAQELDLPLLSHSGDGHSPTQYAEPKYFGEVLSHFPKLRLVLAHIGAPYYDQAKELARSFPELNFDCSDLLSPEAFDLDNDELVMLFREVGTQRIIFGTDFPFHDRKVPLARMREMALTEEEKRQILGLNAVRVYKLD